MKTSSKEPKLRLRERPVQSVNVLIPEDVLDSLGQVANARDMSVDALMRYYIGQGLRQDLARLFADKMFDTTAAVLAKHLHSQEEVSLILDEIREAAGAR